ncbi:hypothetical protein F4604DRAFT_1688190 [Suillus subluteus]|nr:hypothetical protein F4604DRAFT_1688190 [Suillus subluteus]
MDKVDATTLLEFWFTCQENNIQPPFAFKAWQDFDGEIHEAAVHPSLECTGSDGLLSSNGKRAPSISERGSISPPRLTRLPKSKGTQSRQNATQAQVGTSQAVNVPAVAGSGNARWPAELKNASKEMGTSFGTCTRSKEATITSQDHPIGVKC